MEKKDPFQLSWSNSESSQANNQGSTLYNDFNQECAASFGRKVHENERNNDISNRTTIHNESDQWSLVAIMNK